MVIVGVDDGVTPLTARNMLAEYTTSSGGYMYSPSYRRLVLPGGLYVSIENLPTSTLKVFLRQQPDAFVNMSFYDASYSSLGGPPSCRSRAGQQHFHVGADLTLDG